MYGVLLPLINEVDSEETLLVLFKLKQRLWEKGGTIIHIGTEDIKLMIATIDRRLKHCCRTEKERLMNLKPMVELQSLVELQQMFFLPENGFEHTQPLTSFKNLSFRQESYDNMNELRTMLFNALYSIPTFK